MEIQDQLDWKDDGPQVVRKGHLHRVEVEIYVPEGTTPKQIEEAIGLELGFGSMGPDNPMYNGKWEVRNVEHREDMNRVGYSLWEAHDERHDGKRHGRTIHRRPGEPVNATYTPPSQN